MNYFKISIKTKSLYIGAAVIVPPEQEEIAEERFKEHEFNVVANEMMSVNRTLADSRFPE